MGFFSKLFGGNNEKTAGHLEDTEDEANKKQLDDKKKEDEIESYTFPDGTIIGHNNEILDTNSPENIAKFKHNLKILIAEAKEKGKVENFYLIREDDFFPENWEWNVLSDQTNLEPVMTPLSRELRKAYALEKAGIQQYKNIGEIAIPNVTENQEQEALSRIDKNIGAILVPSHFRSTKHFTVNTPLGVTGDYNSVESNRKFVVFDKIDNFLKSGYGYSIAGHDAYLDVTHEPLEISEQGFVMINAENYDEIMKNPKIKEDLSKRKVILFKGDENVAIDMVLAAHGALPTQVGYMYANYDEELREIYESSFKNLAAENGLLYDQSHGGKEGHFSDYYDGKNLDNNKAMQEFIKYLREKFPENEDLIPEHITFNSKNSYEIVHALGANNVLAAINEYNEKAKSEMAKKQKTYKSERESITTEEHKKFVDTVKVVSEFYKNPEAKNESDFEDIIQQFFQGKSKTEQLEASEKIITMLGATTAAFKNIDMHTFNEAKHVEQPDQTKQRNE